MAVARVSNVPKPSHVAGESKPVTAGVFSVKDGDIALKLSSAPTRLQAFRGHKVEALELLPNGGMVMGTDDENFGGWVYAVR